MSMRSRDRRERIDAVSRRSVKGAWCAAIVAALAPALLIAQPSRMAALVEAVRPALPFPASTPDGDLPADNSAQSKWFVIWPDSDDTQIIVRANPLHPETQEASREAMERINAAVAAAERRAQAAYDRAIDELRRTGKSSSALELVSLDDEGVAGERIDAELEVVIELQPAATFEIASGEAPVVTAGAGGPSWVVSIPADTYRDAEDDEHFRPREVRLYFGALAEKPAVSRKDGASVFVVTVPPASEAFAVAIRGNEALVRQITVGAAWSRLAEAGQRQ